MKTEVIDNYNFMFIIGSVPGTVGIGMRHFSKQFNIKKDKQTKTFHSANGYEKL